MTEGNKRAKRKREEGGMGGHVRAADRYARGTGCHGASVLLFGKVNTREVAELMSLHSSYLALHGHVPTAQAFTSRAALLSSPRFLHSSVLICQQLHIILPRCRLRSHLPNLTTFKRQSTSSPSPQVLLRPMIYCRSTD